MTILPFALDSYHDPAGASLWEIFVSRATEHPLNLVAAVIFFLAICHTLLTSRFTHLGHYLERKRIREMEAEGRVYVKERDMSFRSEIFLFLGEVEVVFGLWVIALLGAIISFYSWDTAVEYLDSRNYREPLFVIVIMTLSATRPILRLAHSIIEKVARLGGGSPAAWWLSLLTIGPLLGSFITEPGAMTITALLLARQFYARRPRLTFAYATLGLLFVNVSVGGVLTQFAAPPVLVVADKWGWTASYVFMHFGWKAGIGIVVSNLLYFIVFFRDFKKLREPVKISAVGAAALGGDTNPIAVPLWITCVHVLAVGAVVWAAHDTIIFIGVFLLFLGFYQATAPHQRPLNLRLPLLVGLFLAALMIHGAMQGWWIQPLLNQFTEFPLMLVAGFLTTFNDNAAITYMASLSPNVTEGLKYAVMAGAISGGGLTVMANAPNPAGQQILSRFFEDGISPLRLFLGAIIPTIIVGTAFALLA
jgi:Putative Na+/H+ antiporter